MHHRAWLLSATLAALLPVAAATSPGMVVAGDDPAYDCLARLAADGLVPRTAARHFAGEGEALYTTEQIVDFVELAARAFQADYAGGAGDEYAPLRVLVRRYRRYLAERGFDVARLLALLPEPIAGGSSGFASVSGEARIGAGGDVFDGRAELDASAFFSDRLRAGLSLTTEGTWPLHRELERNSIRAYYIEYEPSRHLGMTAGRVAGKLGPGLGDLLWSDRARPIDGLGFEWHSKLFGRPYRLWHQTGSFHEGFDKYVTVQRYEWEPADWCTMGLGFGLVTDRAAQALASLFLPAYAVRFLAGDSDRGGEGNMLGALDVAVRPTEQWSLYAQIFADDYDFSPDPPATAQRVGYLGGVLHEPGGLPGSMYRLEACMLPDTGTYVGQQNPRQSWTHGPMLLGHEYGQDSWGIRFFGRQRLSERFDVSADCDYFRQLRESADPARTLRLDLHARYDLGTDLQVGLGYRHREFRNRGGVAGLDRTENQIYVEARGIY